jgi:hypothetical protein
MSAIELPLQDIFCAKPASRSSLLVVKRDLTPEEVEQITDSNGWADFREADLQEVRLPSLGPERFYTSRHSLDPGRGVVVPVRGRNYRVTLRCPAAGVMDDLWEAAGKVLVLTPTDDPPTPEDAKGGTGSARARCYLRFFGQPTWVQNEHHPADRHGRACFHLVTVENHWGDMGNWNVLIGLDATGTPDLAYFEASCC